MAKDYQPPAFPLAFNPETQNTEDGMDLRDYFAAKAMQAIITRASGGEVASVCAEYSYILADAMMKERMR